MCRETIKCRVCHTTIVYNNPHQGCTDVGHFENATNWKLVNETFYGKAFPTCPKCLAKAREAVKIIEEMYGTLYISLNSI